MAENIAPSLFDDLLQKLIGRSTSTNVDETLDVKNKINQGTTGSTSGTTTGTTNQTQSTNADISRLTEVYNKQKAGLTPEALAAIFSEGSKAAPGLVASTANAVGARSGTNSALGTALTELSSNLTNTAATQNQQLLKDSGTTAAQIAELTKSLATSGTTGQSTTGTNNSTVLTDQNQGSTKNTDTKVGETINAKSAGMTAGAALLASLFQKATAGGTGGGTDAIAGLLKSLMGGASGGASTDLSSLFGGVGAESTFDWNNLFGTGGFGSTDTAPIDYGSITNGGQSNNSFGDWFDFGGNP